MEKVKQIIVSRHPAAIEFIARELGADSTRYVLEAGAMGEGFPPEEGIFIDGTAVPIIAQASADDVRGQIVYGNLPLSLACEAYAVVAIEFTGQPPRGLEYSLADMDAAGAVLSTYTVHSGLVRGIPQGCGIPKLGSADPLTGFTVVRTFAPSDCESGEVVLFHPAEANRLVKSRAFTH